MSERRVMITGLGLVSPYACGREASWTALRSGRRALRALEIPAAEVSRWPVGSAGAPAMLDPALPSRLQDSGRDDLASLCDEPVISTALSAAIEAVHDAGLGHDFELHSGPARNRIGCVIGTSKGGVHSIDRQFARSCASGDSPLDPDPLWWTRISPSGPACAVSSLFGLSGPLFAPVTACATGLTSLIRAAALIRSGECDIVLAGSSDASLTPAVVSSFRRLGVLASSALDPGHAVRPCDRQRSGFLIGEGAAVFVLEAADHARQRGADGRAEWLGGEIGTDSSGITSLEMPPLGLMHVLRRLLDRSGITPRDIDYINLHGTATPMNDVCETLAVREVFGSDWRYPSASAIKGAIGHLLGGAGSVEFAATLLAMRDGCIPPTVNLEDVDSECQLRHVVGHSLQRPVQQAMKLSLGFGGHLAAALVRRVSQ